MQEIYRAKPTDRLKSIANQNASDAALPVATSRALGWQSLVVEEFQQPPGKTEVIETWSEYHLALCLAPRPHRIHQTVGNRRYTGLYAQGDISITPANVPTAYQAEGHDHYVHIQIPTPFLRSVAEQTDLNPDRVELLTEFRVRDPQLEQAIRLLRGELHKGALQGGQLYVDSLANVLAVHLLREYSTQQPRVAVYEGGLGDRKLLQVADYVHAHLDQAIKLADLAAIAGVSQYHFSRLFKQSMGVSPHQYLQQQRVERAKELLKGSEVAIADIALQCGFNSQSHLGKYFRQFTGVTPGSYRRG